MNKVIAGDYKGQGIMRTANGICITLPMFKTLSIRKDTVDSYEVLDKSTQTSSFDAVRRASNWSFFFGKAGYAAALGAKTKGTYRIAVRFKDGKKSLLELDEKTFYALSMELFN